jgi:chromosome partitioning protein
MHKPYIIVIGNEKGGAGKTTISMHLITSLLDLNFKVVSIDTDSRQRSLSRYLENREFSRMSKNLEIPMPIHYTIKESFHLDIPSIEHEEKTNFEQILEDVEDDVDFIVIDTPGRNSFLSRLAHSYADTIITPINDSFIDLDVLAKINSKDMQIEKPSIYSQLVWEQKMQRAKRDKQSINWVVVRNRLSHLDAKNKRNIADVLEKLSKRIAFKIAHGFSERVVFRELFLQGLTLLDLKSAGYSFNMSHVAARQELRDFLNSLNIDSINVRIENQALGIKEHA